MKQITQNLRWLVTLLAMIVSVGAWATEYKLTISASDFNTTSYAANNNEKTTQAVCTSDASKTFDVKWTSNQVMKNVEDMQWQKNNGYLFNSTNLGTIKSVTVTSSGGTFTIFYGTTAHPTSGATVGNGFFTVKVGNALGTTSKVEVVFEKLDPVATPTFSVAEGTYTEAKSVTISCTTENASIYYTTDGTTPTNESSLYSGAITISSTTTLKAIAVKEGYDNSKVATALYTISIPISGYTVNFESSLDCYVDWIFENIGIHNSEITAHGGTFYGANVNSNGNGVASATIRTKQPVVNPTMFICYVSKESNNTTASTWYVEVSSDGTNWETVTSQDAKSMNKGEWTEVTADLSAYSNVYVRLRYNGSTAIRAVDDISIALGGTPKVATPIFSVAGGTYTETQSVEISCTTEDATIYYTTDGNEPTTNSTEYRGAIDISSTTTLKAIAVKPEMRNSDVAEVTYTINIPQPVSEEQYALVTSNDQLEAGKEYIIVGKYSTFDTYFAMSTTQNENNRGIVGITVSGDIATISSSDVQVITLEGSSEGWYFRVGNGYLYAASSEKNYLRTETTKDDNAKATIEISNGNDATIVFQGNFTHNNLRFNNGQELFSCYLPSSSMLPVQLYKKKPVSETVRISDVGWATYVTNNALDFSDTDVTAYIIEPECINKKTHQIALIEKTEVPAGTAILISKQEGSDNSFEIPIICNFDLSSDNALQASDGSVEGNGKIYVLNQVNGNVGFYPLNNGKTLSAGKAYLDMTNYLSESSDDVKYFFSFGNETVDAINKMDAEEGLGVLYNLNGQRVAAPLKGGIYIMNGKKVFISTLKTN